MKQKSQVCVFFPTHSQEKRERERERERERKNNENDKTKQNRQTSTAYLLFLVQSNIQNVTRPLTTTCTQRH